MSESTPSTIPPEEDTQPLKPVKKGPRWRSNLISVAGVLVLLGLSLFGGYRVALIDRMNAERSIIHTQLAEQYQFALVDIQFGRFEAAKERLDFIIAHDPGYPGATESLTQVLVAMSAPTQAPTALPTPTPNPSGAESIYNTAQQLIAAGDWVNALVALDEVRKADPGYKTSLVDGMYYFSLRNYGYSLIVNNGNLEGGIYQLTLAERFAPLDNNANGLREGARAYITAASFFGVNWEQAVSYLGGVYNGWPSLWDGTMTASQRYHIALMRYGDELFEQNRFCDAYAQYDAATRVGNLDEAAAKNANQAFQQCYPATPTLEVGPTATETSSYP
jgi:tetratricopeptide (TPR) repeat protein